MRPVFGDRRELRASFKRFLAATAHLRRPTLSQWDPWPYEWQSLADWIRGRPRTLVLPPAEDDASPVPERVDDP